MKAFEESASLLIPSIDKNIPDIELLYITNEVGTKFMFLDHKDEEIDYDDVEEAARYAKCFLGRIGWVNQHDA
jgi:hypothetical protein